ncbi:hypothetical protein NUW54_g9534 [Trametes sanguinea]|uniref:Uncharacterized protein n=1 Tax=Trametes sanguinea TaxID=158606 RepID=A0ACC1P6I7_9APHY|nr:hypothetical protein NUW54_g9534 [Trametes sanguinea]
MTKAALNMLAVKQKAERPDLTVITLCPGPVKTGIPSNDALPRQIADARRCLDMNKENGQLEPEESVAGILKVITAAQDHRERCLTAILPGKQKVLRFSAGLSEYNVNTMVLVQSRDLRIGARDACPCRAGYTERPRGMRLVPLATRHSPARAQVAEPVQDASGTLFLCPPCHATSAHAHVPTKREPVLDAAEDLDVILGLLLDEDVLGPAARLHGERVVNLCQRKVRISTTRKNSVAELGLARTGHQEGL